MAQPTLVTDEDILKCQQAVYWLAHRARQKSSLSHQTTEDLIQEGMVGIARAAKTFNPAQRVKFSTYALTFAAGHIRHYIRDYHHRGARTKEQIQARPAPVPLDDVWKDDDGTEQPRVDEHLKADEQGFHTAEWRATLVTYPPIVKQAGLLILDGHRPKEVKRLLGLRRPLSLRRLLADLGDPARDACRGA